VTILKNNRYKEAIDELNLSIDEQKIMNHALQKKKRKNYLVYAFAFAVLIVVVAGSIFFYTPTMDLYQATGDVKVKLMDLDYKDISSSDNLVFLTEEEIFKNWVTDSFYGEVTHVENIEMVVGGYSDYSSIITFKILDAIHTIEKENKEVTILLPNQIKTDVKTSNSYFSEQLTVGTRAIILANRYNETSIYQVNDNTLYLQELATFGLPDGMRFVMLENSDGTLRYMPDVFTSLNNAKQYDEIKNYLIRMME